MDLMLYIIPDVLLFSNNNFQTPSILFIKVHDPAP
jgi:hypothetical protein